MRDKPTDGFAVCPVHGDIFWHEGAAWYDVIDSCVVEIVTDLPITGMPRFGDEALCPVVDGGVCREWLRFELRPTVRRLDERRRSVER